MIALENEHEHPLSDQWIRARWGENLTDQDCERKRSELEGFAAILLDITRSLKPCLTP